MNYYELKKPVQTLKFVEVILENLLMSMAIDSDDEFVFNELQEACELLDHLNTQLGKAIPGFQIAVDQCNNEAQRMGAIFSKQRIEQIDLLRLSGDNTPEEEIPFGPFRSGSEEGPNGSGSQG